MIKYEVETQHSIIFERKFRNLFKKILGLKNQEINNKVRDIINYLGDMNIHTFKDLIYNED